MRIKAQKDPTCGVCAMQLCIRYILVAVVGVCIGWGSTFFVQLPPAAILVKDIQDHKDVENRIVIIEQKIKSLDDELVQLKKQVR